MWEKTLIESNVYSRNKRVRWTMPVAAILHVAILIGVILFSYWQVEAMEAPQSSLEYVAPIQVAIGPPPQLGQRHPPKNSEAPSKPAAPMQNVAPVVVPPLSQNESAEASMDGEATDSNLPIGDPKGIDGGDPTSNGFNAFAPAVGNVEEPQIMTIYMTQPVLIHRVEPEYPKIAMVAHIQGVVILQAVITRSGSVEEVQTLRADDRLLEKAAKDAVLRWQYKPATLRGQPVKVYFTVTVTFHLK